MKIKKSVICGVCPGTCVVNVHLKDGKLIDVFPARNDPYSALCLKGKFAKDILYSLDRLKRILIRMEKKARANLRKQIGKSH